MRDIIISFKTGKHQNLMRYKNIYIINSDDTQGIILEMDSYD